MRDPSLSGSITLTRTFHVRRASRGRKTFHASDDAVPVARVPWVAKWMALAIRFEQLIREDQIADQAALARVGHVSRARMTQIMNLNLLAPDIQEELLFLTGDSGRVQLRSLQAIAAKIEWAEQRRSWAALLEQ